MFIGNNARIMEINDGWTSIMNKYTGNKKMSSAITSRGEYSILYKLVKYIDENPGSGRAQILWGMVGRGAPEGLTDEDVRGRYVLYWKFLKANNIYKNVRGKGYFPGPAMDDFLADAKELKSLYDAGKTPKVAETEEDKKSIKTEKKEMTIADELKKASGGKSGMHAEFTPTLNTLDDVIIDIIHDSDDNQLKRIVKVINKVLTTDFEYEEVRENYNELADTLSGEPKEYLEKIIKEYNSDEDEIEIDMELGDDDEFEIEDDTKEINEDEMTELLGSMTQKFAEAVYAKVYPDKDGSREFTELLAEELYQSIIETV
jgi:hypothetical protein